MGVASSSWAPGLSPMVRLVATPPRPTEAMLAALKQKAVPPEPLPQNDPNAVQRLISAIAPLQEPEEYARRASEARAMASTNAVNNARREAEMEEANAVHEELSKQLPDRKKVVPQRAPGMPPPRRTIKESSSVQVPLQPRAASTSYKSFPPPTPPMSHHQGGGLRRHTLSNLKLMGEEKTLQPQPQPPPPPAASEEQPPDPNSPRFPAGWSHPVPPAPTPQPQYLSSSPLPPELEKPRSPDLVSCGAAANDVPAPPVGVPPEALPQSSTPAHVVVRSPVRAVGAPTGAPPPPRWRHSEARSGTSSSPPRLWRPSGVAHSPERRQRSPPGRPATEAPGAEDTDDLLQMMMELPPLEGRPPPSKPYPNAKPRAKGSEEAVAEGDAAAAATAGGRGTRGQSRRGSEGAGKAPARFAHSQDASPRDAPELIDGAPLARANSPAHPEHTAGGLLPEGSSIMAPAPAAAAAVSAVPEPVPDTFRCDAAVLSAAPLAAPVLQLSSARLNAPPLPMSIPAPPLASDRVRVAPLIREARPPSASQGPRPFGPPPASVVRWAKEQQAVSELRTAIASGKLLPGDGVAAYGHLPRPSADPNLHDRTERNIFDRMQIKLAQASRQQHALKTGPPASTAIGYDDYAMHVYAATYTLAGRGGRPVGSPRRMLSNRWDSAVMSRSHDIRLSLTGSVDAASVPVHLPAVPGASPRNPPQGGGGGGSGGSLSARPVLITSQRDVSTEPLGADELLDAESWGLPDSPRELQAALSRQILADAVDSYDRTPRWRVRS